MDALKRKQDERAAFAKKIHELDEQRKSAGGEWTDEIRQQFREAKDAIVRIDDEIRSLREQKADEEFAAALRGAADADPREPVADTGEQVITRADHAAALRAWLAPTMARNEDLAAARRVGLNLSGNKLQAKLSPQQFRNRKEVDQFYGEQRAQSVGTTTAGGFTVPDEMMRAIEVSMLAFTDLRPYATVIRTDSGADLPIPTTNDTSNKGAILAENTAASEQDVTFGQLVLQAYKYSSKMVKVSVELLQDSAVDVPSLLGRLLGERLGRIHSEHFTTGTGSSQPNGIVTAAGNSGVTLASSTAITYSELLQIKHSLDPAYRPNARWMFHDTWLRYITSIVDSNGNPIWMPGFAADVPDTILGHPYVVNNECPTGTSAKVVLFGDLSKYIIRDVRDITVLRLDERYADAHQVAFLAFSRNDGDLLDAGTDPVKYATSAAT